MSSDHSSRAWVERAESALAAAGRKRGGARRALLELLARQTCALTALEIEDALRAGGRGATSGQGAARRGAAGEQGGTQTARRGVSRASVYRILDGLEDLRLVARVETGQAMVRYERAHDPAEGHHHHLVCDSCGLVMPFSDEALERAIDALSARVPLAVAEHEIVLHGACRECAA
jgi:Fur family ferric uptake transcriptional regulator